MLAAHRATAKHLATKLCRRFVADEPPADCVEQAAAAFSQSGGDIPAMIRAIVAHPAFFAEQSRGTKLKSPLEAVASSLRAVNAAPDGTLRLALVLARMGQPLLLESAPTGYAETRDAWLGSSAMLARMTFATALAAKKKLGARVDLDAVLPVEPSDTVVERASQLLFDGQLGKAMRAALEQETSGVANEERRRALALALLLGGPSFQRQ